jgi:hypothetical protein
MIVMTFYLQRAAKTLYHEAQAATAKG